MKAIDILKEISLKVAKGSDVISTANKYNYSLEILKGDLKPRKTYYCTFKESEITSTAPDVVIIMGGGDVQFLYEIN